jgi:quercetin dioxygenase-like cupin family protein
MNDILSFEDEAQAHEEIAAMGYHAMALDFPAEENDMHWHDFDSVVYVTAGEVTLSLDNGESAVCQRGAKIVASAGVAHREKTSGYSAIIGFSVAPEALTQPVNKPLPVAL